MRAAGIRHAKPPAKGINYNIVYQIKTLYCLAVNMVKRASRNAKNLISSDGSDAGRDGFA